MNSTHLLIPGYIPKKSDFHCCICGDFADGTMYGKDFFGETFRDYREMKDRLSPYICEACALSLKDVPSGVVHYIDGSIKTPKSAQRGLGWRFFSWILVEGCEPVGATKAHCKELRDILANPPVNKEFSIIIADSGQKQLIYRMETQHVSSKITPFFVQFETERVKIDPEFWSLLHIANRLAKISGKSRVLDDPNVAAMTAYMKEYGDDASEEYMKLSQERDTAKARLAAFLCENKENGNE